VISPDFSVEVPEQLGKVHFIGIGGSGMSGLARLLAKSGHIVTGSDVRGSGNIDSLRELGVEIAIGHDPTNLGDADTVVVTGALWENNPELVLARQLGLPILHRAVLLSSLANSKRLIAVAGAHGKTTTTGMLITALRNLGADPSFVNGGVIVEYGLSSDFGSGELFVIEADESDGSFLNYETSIAVITNVDADHLDHYGSDSAFFDAFNSFASNASEFAVVNQSDPGCKKLEVREQTGTLGFGYGKTSVEIAKVDASGPQVTFSLSNGKISVDMKLKIAGEHNAQNAAAAVTVLTGLGYDFEASCQAVELYQGAERRFEFHGESRGVRVYDDFAHHPTEVAAALAGARANNPDGKLITVFQPHLYSRTRIFQKEFAEVLSLSDQVIVTDVYAAREDPEPGVSGELITRHFEDSDRVHYVPNWDSVPQVAAQLAGSGDFIITMGCGDIYKMCPDLLDSLEKR
jgi:UDP-N-acetylmuramate--alanine ligase